VVAGVAVLLVAVGCTSAGTATGSPASGQATAAPTGASSATPVAGPGTTPASATTSGPGADWPTYDRTAERSGVSISSPAAGVLRRSWTAAVDGAVYAQPLVVGSEVIVATENDSVYALDASSGAVRWSRHLAAPVTRGLPCGNIDPSGITGTPVADVATGRLWVVTFTDQPAYRHTLTELDLAAGRTVSQRPIDASGSDPRAQLERGALALLGSRVYVPFGGLYGDCSDYRGRVIWHRTGRDRAQPGGQLGWPAGHHPAGLVASGWGLLQPQGLGLAAAPGGWGLLQPQGAGACRGPGGSRWLKF
jgi:outer membrane protein assembly factor BamB